MNFYKLRIFCKFAIRIYCKGKRERKLEKRLNFRRAKVRCRFSFRRRLLLKDSCLTIFREGGERERRGGRCKSFLIWNRWRVGKFLHGQVNVGVQLRTPGELIKTTLPGERRKLHAVLNAATIIALQIGNFRGVSGAR